MADLILENFSLDNAIEAILFVAGEGVELSLIAEKLEIDLERVKKSINKLKEKFSNESGLHLITYKNKAQLSSNPEYADYISSVLNPIKEKQLSRAALETIAIIAYKQPITRLEIEQIRGVNCDYAVQLLTQHNLIEVVGRKDVVGKPLLFGTTEQFLKRFEIDDINILPDYEALLDRIKVIHSEQTEELYNTFKIPDEEEIPEFLKGEDLESVTAASET